MLGMMNSASADHIDVYGARGETRVRKQESIEQTQAFTEVKKKQAVSYTQDGDRLVDGKMVKKPEGMNLWMSLIKQEAMTCLIEEEAADTNASKSEESNKTTEVKEK